MNGDESGRDKHDRRHCKPEFQVLLVSTVQVHRTTYGNKHAPVGICHIRKVLENGHDDNCDKSLIPNVRSRMSVWCPGKDDLQRQGNQKTYKEVVRSWDVHLSLYYRAGIYEAETIHDEQNQ